MFNSGGVRASGFSKTTARYDEGLRSYVSAVYTYMSVALAITGLVSFGIASSPRVMGFFVSSGMYMICLLATLGIGLYMQLGIQKIRFQTMQTLFWVHAFVFGAGLSPIFFMYTGASLVKVFFITSSVFGVSSIYGHTTKKDLTSIGSILMMGLWGIIIAGLVNLFFRSSAIEFACSLLSVVIFTGLIAFYNQQIKSVYNNFGRGDPEMAHKLGVIGALCLYTAFVNLFISILRLIGKTRE